jgi:general secretion pathway protein J
MNRASAACASEVGRIQERSEQSAIERLHQSAIARLHQSTPPCAPSIIAPPTTAAIAHIPQHQRGFTLLEVLIAISIFAFLALGTYRMLSSVLASDEATRRHELQLRELQRAFAVLEQDLAQVGSRPIRDAFGDLRPAMVGEAEPAAMEFSRLGWRNPLGTPRSSWQRVRWQLVGNVLQRSYWSVLDQAVDSQPLPQKVLSEVRSLQLRYLDRDGNWQTEWPPEQTDSDAQKSLLQVPRAVEISLEHERYGQLTRLLRLPDTPKPKQQGPQGGDPDQPNDGSQSGAADGYAPAPEVAP